MADNITLSAEIPFEISREFYEKRELFNLVFSPFIKQNAIKFYESDFENLKVRLYPNNRIQITGSLAKFQSAITTGIKSNHTDFDYVQIKKIVKIIEKKFANKLKISKIENGINLIMLEKPQEYINLVKSYKSIHFDKMKHRHIDYGKKAFSSYKNVKLYDKTLQTKLQLGIIVEQNILRFEVEYSRNNPLFKTIRTLADLKDFSKYTFFKKELIKEFSNIKFDDNNLDASFLSEPEITLYHAGKSRSYIEDLILSGKKNTHNVKKKIKEINNKVTNHPYSKGTLVNELATKIKDKIQELSTCNIL